MTKAQQILAEWLKSLFEPTQQTTTFQRDGMTTRQLNHIKRVLDNEFTVYVQVSTLGDPVVVTLTGKRITVESDSMNQPETILLIDILSALITYNDKR